MYSIGQFSVMTKIPAKTLRYYDEIDLLKPARVAYSNNYRYYDEESVLRAQQVLIYRGCGLPLEKIKEVLDRTMGPANLKEVLITQLELLTRKLEEIHSSRSVIQKIIQSLEEEKMEEVSLKKHAAQTVLSIRDRGNHDAIGPMISRLFETAAASELRVNGPHTIVWYEDRDFSRETIDMEIYIPVDADDGPPAEFLRPPGGQTGVNRPTDAGAKPDLLSSREAQLFCEVLHRGPFSTLSSAYTRLYSYIEEHQLSVSGPAEETYLSRMGFVNPQNMEVRVAVPVTEKI